MPTDYAAVIVNHLRSIMPTSDWRFHGPSVERIICKSIDEARKEATSTERAAVLAALHQVEDSRAKLQDQAVEERASTFIVDESNDK
jgi:hypothetical protein